MRDSLLFSVNKNINAFFNCIKIYYNKKIKKYIDNSEIIYYYKCIKTKDKKFKSKYRI